ncbi:hypothetical protein UNDKW_4045 [Undibacterium sp. KW1]|nr:hypothetical protein UNDKW_4045 [Undibacterium sp. KW1]
MSIVGVAGVAGDFAIGGDNAFLAQVVACVDKFYCFAIGVGDFREPFAIVAVGGDIAAGVAGCGQLPHVAIATLIGFCLVSGRVGPGPGRAIAA